MTHLALFMLCLAGFAALALGMERTQEDLFGRALTSATVRRLRVAGWVVLLAALACAVRAQGWSLGLVSYSGHTSLAAGVVFGALVLYGRLKPSR
ncbi:DUF3325 domain-containing protein [Variovorax paradoxus]|jgi:hypothetical protein|uniref:DUF3325 domain-containing protein n=1 Tax=Variovorax paradoxus TaxID=34073 RepID=A0A679JRY4_VARPD|nr:hypothetical protein VVAX_05331 [Variovorax paradoxus]